jgi:hypothetical protein
MYRGNRQILLDMRGVLDPGQSILGDAQRTASSVWLRWLRPGGISGAALVAPRSGQVHPDEQEDMVSLLAGACGRRP